jgi:hypothetical protein
VFTLNFKFFTEQQGMMDNSLCYFITEGGTSKNFFDVPKSLVNPLNMYDFSFSSVFSDSLFKIQSTSKIG